jgi:hypothetical protein
MAAAPVADAGGHGGGGLHGHRQDFLADEGIEHRRLSGAKLPEDGQTNGGGLQIFDQFVDGNRRWQ